MRTGAERVDSHPQAGLFLCDILEEKTVFLTPATSPARAPWQFGIHPRRIASVRYIPPFPFAPIRAVVGH